MQVISVRSIPNELSVWRDTAPGMAAVDAVNARLSQSRCAGGLTVEERGPAAPALELGRALVQGSAAPDAGIDTLLVVLVVLARVSGVRALLAQDAEL